MKSRSFPHSINAHRCTEWGPCQTYGPDRERTAMWPPLTDSHFCLSTKASCHLRFLCLNNRSPYRGIICTHVSERASDLDRKHEEKICGSGTPAWANEMDGVLLFPPLPRHSRLPGSCWHRFLHPLRENKSHGGVRIHIRDSPLQTFGVCVCYRTLPKFGENGSEERKRVWNLQNKEWDERTEWSGWNFITNTKLI